MKKKILYCLIIILLLCIIFVVGIKIYYSSKIIDENKNNDEIIVIDDKKELYVMDCAEEKIYNNDDLISSNRKIISLTFYEDTIKVCISDEGICEEVGYKMTDNELYINDGIKISFSGLYNIIDLSDNKMVLEKNSDNGYKYVYQFEAPIG